MKKSKIILLGATFLVTLGLSFTSPTQAATTAQDTATTTQSNSDVPESVQNAVDDLFDNYVADENVDVEDASISHPTTSMTELTHYSFNEFSKIPIIKNYFIKAGFPQTDQLNNVEFSYVIHEPRGDGDPYYWGLITAYYNNNEIESKKVKIDGMNSGKNPAYIFSNPINLVGQVTATNREGRTSAPLVDTVNKDSNRSLAPNSDWYTDQFMFEKRTGELYYRVSTSEWVNEHYIKPHANTNIKITDFMSNPKDKTYQVTWRRISGQPLYKSDGELWNYTLPDGSIWKVTAIGFDQYGSAYCEVSTNAWIRMDHALQ